MNVKELAQKLGVSRTSIYLYLNDPSTTRIGWETKQRIEEALQGESIYVNVNAQSLQSGRSYTIVALVPLKAPFFRNELLSQTLAGVESELDRSNYSLAFVPATADNIVDATQAQLESAKGYDGFILYGTRASTMEQLTEAARLLVEADVPAVTINVPEVPLPINQVINFGAWVISPTEYLVQHGHEKILLMAGAPNAPDTTQEINEYRRQLNAHGYVSENELILHGYYEKDIAYSKITDLIRSQGVTFTAVYCLSDAMAIGVYEALHENGLSIPKDVSVISKDDSFFASAMAPPLTSVRGPLYEAGEKAADLLVRHINYEEPHRKIYLFNELVVRRSVAARPNRSIQYELASEGG